MDSAAFSPPFMIPPDAAAELAAIRALINNHKQEAIRRCEALSQTARRNRQPATLIAVAELYGLVVPQYGRDTLFEALQLAQAYGWIDAEARLDEQIARSYYTTGDYRPARQFWERALALASEPEGELETWLYGQIGLGQVHDALGNHPAAVACHQAALEHALATQLDNAYLLAKIRINLAVNLIACQQDAEARIALEMALEDCRNAGLLDYAAEALSRLGELAQREGDLDLAGEHYREALQLTRQISYHWAETNILHQLSQLAAVQGDLPLAQRLCGEGIGLAEMIGYTRQRMEMLAEAASYAEQLGDIPAAYGYLQAHNRLLQRQLPAAPSQESRHAPPDRLQQRLFALANHALIEQGNTAEAVRHLLAEASTLLQASGASLWLLGAQCGLQCVDPGATAAPASIDAEIGHPLYLHLQSRPLLNACLSSEHPLIGPLMVAWRHEQPVSILLQAVSDGEASWVLWLESSQARRNWLPDDEALLGQLCDILQRILARQRQRALHAQLEEINNALQDDNRALAEHVARRGAALQQALAQLAHSERLATTGRLMAGMAHELNTPLGVAMTASSTIANNLALLIERIRTGKPGRDEVIDALQQCREAASLTDRNILRAAELIRRFRSLNSHQEAEELSVYRIDELLQGVCRLYQEELQRHGHVLLLTVPERLEWPVRPAALQHVLGQLLGNVLEHAFTDRRSGCVQLTVQPRDGKLIFTLHDNGIGMSPDAVSHAFDPFYLSQLGRGGGLGLYGAYNLVTAVLGGEIAIHSQQGEYTAVTLILPA